MIFKLANFSVQNDNRPVSLRCPACRQLGTFEAVNTQAIFASGNPPVSLCQRRCPNHACRAHIFVAFDVENRVLVSYPPERIDFDTTAIPVPIVSALEEAITCHANRSFVAAAIMIRRTLEELCAEKSATGKTLKDRLASLGSSVILPTGLIAGLDNLRLLGNDAAHVESRVYAQVGKAEVETAIDVAKEVLKAVYQLDNLVARLESLKSPKQ